MWFGQILRVDSLVKEVIEGRMEKKKAKKKATYDVAG